MFRDIELFNPKFVRVERENDNIVFDFENNIYVARDKEKYEGLSFEDYLKKAEHEHGVLSYHISLRSADNKRALLVFESDEVGGEEVILKLCGLIREKGIKFILKDSGNRSLHLVIPILCNDKQDYEKQFNTIFYLLGEKERAFIDVQLNNIDKQVRGFESLHLKTYKQSEIKSGSLENINNNLCSENTKLINSFSGVFQKSALISSAGVTSVMGKSKNTRSSFLFDTIELNRQEQLLEVARNLKKGERGVCLTYIASKLKKND